MTEETPPPDLLDAIHARAINAGYAADIREFEIGGARRRRLAFGLPSDDDEPRAKVIVTPESADIVAASSFDDFRPLEDFEAIWSPGTGVIECALDTGSPGFAPVYLLDYLARRLGLVDLDAAVEGDREQIIEVPPPRDDLRIVLQLGSIEFAILRPLFGRRTVLRADRLPRIPVLRVEGYYAASPEQAQEFLERLGNAVLFQLDLRSDLPISLSRPIPTYVRNEPEHQPGATTLKAPAHELDAEPMALYWYGRTALRMPLLQFLAFYQVVEYYFPIYSESKVREVLRRMLKDPRFNVENPADLTRLIAQVKPSRSGRGYGDERSQLQATLQECTSPDELRAFVEADDRRKRFFERSTSKKMPLVAVKVPVGSEDADLRPAVAERLYAIRCRIVHTKTSDDASERLLLPFSREASLLRFDTEIMEFVARQVLIAASRPLRLN